jgi:hypothetical protein
MQSALSAPGAPSRRLLRHAHRELRGSRQARVTRRVLLDPLAELLGLRLGDPEAIQTSLGQEDGSQPLFLNGSEKAAARVLAIPAEASLDLPPEGLHRRFAPAHSLVRVLEQEGLTWGILLNAYELRVVRRSEGFVSSHLAFSLLDLAADLPGARDAWRLLWGLLRGDAWQQAPTLLDEVVRLGREHQQEVGGILGSQVPTAVERLLQGALTHPSNREKLAPFLTSPADRRALLEHLHGGALSYLYRTLFVLYAEARGLLALDMPAYRDGYALSGARGLVRRVMDRATDPRANPKPPPASTNSASAPSFACCAMAPISDPKAASLPMAAACFTRTAGLTASSPNWTTSAWATRPWLTSSKPSPTSRPSAAK